MFSQKARASTIQLAFVSWSSMPRINPANLSPNEREQLVLLAEKAALPTRSHQQPQEATVMR